MAARSLFGKSMMEFIGTFLLLVVAGSHAPGEAVAGVLIGIIYMGYEISGAHYNPAVTLTFFLRGRCTASEVLAFIPMQFVGGVLGASSAYYLQTVGVGDGAAVRFAKGEGYTLTQAMCAEILFTFGLCYSILTTALRSVMTLNPVFGVAIAGVVYAGIVCTGKISGAAFNPAVAVSLALTNGGDLGYALWVTVANLIGMLLATVLFYLTAPAEIKALPWGWAQKLGRWRREGGCEEGGSLLSGNSNDEGRYYDEDANRKS